ncbi:MAG TPA: molybdopterin dinucleotide binding domain-containing protein, partial [Novosphingobium sp.]
MPRDHHRTCHLCEAHCGLVISVDGDAILSIRGDAGNALSRGYICPKAVAIQDIQNDPDRLRRPQKRVGDQWHDIGWEQAFSEIGARARELLAREPNAIAIYRGNPNAHNYGNLFSFGLLRSALGEPQVFTPATMDQIPHLVVNLEMLGHSALFPIPDIDRASTLVVIGGNPAATNGSIWTVPDFRNRVKELRARGGRLVVVDPRRTETAKLADTHLFIHPARDAWFLIALLKEVMASPMRPALPPYVRGADAVEAALAPFDPAACAAIAGVDLGEIRAIGGRLLAGPGAVYGRMGVCVQEFGALNLWLIALINIAAGQFDREGGLVFSEPAIDLADTAEPGAYGRWRSRVSGMPEMMGQMPVAVLAEEIDTPGTGQIKGLFVLAGNPVLSTPNGKRLDRALADIELMVSIDFYRNATSRRAHYILPPVGPLQRDHYGYFLLPLAVRNFAIYSPPLFPAGPDELEEWQIIHRLGEAISGKSRTVIPPSERLDTMLRAGRYGLSLSELAACPSGVDLGPPRAGQLPGRLRTPDKTIELAPAPFLDALARLAPPPEELGQLRLIGRRDIRTNNSWMANSARLAKGPNRCTLMIHPDDAASRGITEGALVEVRSRVGIIRLPAVVTDHIMRGAVSIPHGWGHD